MSLHRGISISRQKKVPATQGSDQFPSDILIERFTSWKEVSKQLEDYFEGIASVESTYAKSYLKLASVIETPFKPAHQFLDKGGIQELYELLRDKTHVIAEKHASFAKTVDSNIVKQVSKIHNDIKSHIKDIQNDTGDLTTILLKDRESSTKALGELSAAIASVGNTDHTIPVKKDPYIANAHVRYQMQKQVHNENLHQKSATIMQKNSAKFEAEIIQSIQSIWGTFDNLSSKKDQAVAETRSTLIASFKALEPSLEWNDFHNRKKDVLIDAEAPLRDEEAMKWPQMDDPATQPLHKGTMERKKRYTRSYKENYYVVTSAGYLHEYPSSNPSIAFTPEFSLYLPACTLGPQSKDGNKFHIEESKHSGSSRGLRGTLGMKSEHEWAFKCENRTEMEAFWESIKPVCARHLQAIETGAVEKEEIKAAVTGVGIPESPEIETEENKEQTTPERSAASLAEASTVTTEPPGYSDQKDPGFAGVGAGAEKKVAPETVVDNTDGDSVTQDTTQSTEVVSEPEAGASGVEKSPTPSADPPKDVAQTESKFKEHIKD